MEILIKILQVVFSFSLLVLVHELGHFMFAKLFKTRVDKFYLFFDPWFSIFKFRIGDTEYGMGWLPLGGYCKIAGMVDESMDKEQMKKAPESWEYRSKPAWQRLLIIIGGVMMNIIMAIAIYIGITFAWGDSYVKNDDVTNGFAFSKVAQDMGFRNGDKVISVGGEAIDNFLQVPAMILFDEVSEAQVERAGELVTIDIDSKYIKAIIEDKTEKFISLRIPFVVGALEEGGGAKSAGVLAGDSLLAVNGVSMQWFDEFKNVFVASKGDTAKVALIRNGVDTLNISIPVSDQGIIGILPSVNLANLYTFSTKQYSFWEAIPAGTQLAFTSIGSYFKQLRLIFSPETEAYKSVGGIIAMGNFFPAEWDWMRFWHITAMLSIMLAVLNILPIPMLDGGHMIFILYEMITRRAPSDKFMEGAQVVGMIIVFGLIILANGNDIIKLIF